MADCRQCGVIRTRRIQPCVSHLHQSPQSVQAYPHQASSELSDRRELLNQMDYVANTEQVDRILTEKGNTQDYLSSEYEIMGLAKDNRDPDEAFIRGRPVYLDEQHKNYVGMVLRKGEKLVATYVRIIIKRKELA